MNDEKIILRDKIVEGLNLAYNRLLEQYTKNDEELVISKNGRIVKVKATELQKAKVELP
jgi:hypothetical protein